jgi:hypothetical protein
MQLKNEQKIRVIDNYNNIKNHIKTNKELIDILAKHLQIKKSLVQYEINIYNANNQNLILKSKINKL